MYSLDRSTGETGDLMVGYLFGNWSTGGSGVYSLDRSTGETGDLMVYGRENRRDSRVGYLFYQAL